jgi:hypothetical protein
MKKIYFLFSITLILLNPSANAQKDQVEYMFSFRAFFDSTELQQNVYYALGKGDSIQIETLKFYISSISFSRKGKIIWSEANSFHLIDVFNPVMQRIKLNAPKQLKFDELVYNVGIDSITNVSGAMGGDLDPANGMYWTWQSGYINLKLEGNSNRCSTRNHAYQFHIGGYIYPENALQKVVLKLKKNPQRNITLAMHVASFLHVIDLSKQNQIMSPGKDAVQLSSILSKQFSLMQP